jgi:hypothetical protein
MNPNLTVVWVDREGSDWLALYADGEKIYEGRPPDFQDSLDFLCVRAETRIFPSAKLSNLSAMRGLPRDLRKVPA